MASDTPDLAGITGPVPSWSLLRSDSVSRQGSQDDRAGQEEDAKSSKPVHFPHDWHFIAGIENIESLPKEDLPEIALAGRSNVGKSSLINAVTRRNGLARVSSTPGRTQLLNFFGSPYARFILVDLPGFGYAQAPLEKVESWSRLVHLYLDRRRSLKRVLFLVDGRHGLKAADLRAMDQFDRRAISYQIVFTKLDKVAASDHAALYARTEKAVRQRPAAYPEMLFTSSGRSMGIDRLQRTIMSIAGSSVSA